MTDSDDIIVLTPDDLDDVRDADRADAPSRARPLWPFTLAGGVVLGFAIAFAAYWYVRSLPIDTAPLQAEIATLRADIDALKSAPAPDAPSIDLGPLTRRIAALEARPSVDPLNEDVVARLEALQAEGFEMPEIPELPDVEGLNARIATLEASLAALATTVEVGASQPVAIEPVVIDPDTLPRFPAQALRDGAQQLSGSGFFRRTFFRHVRVTGSDDPDTLIAGIETDMASGQAHAALEKFDRLPPRLQSLARGWRADMEDRVR